MFGIHLKKVNILYLLHGVISLPDARSCDKFILSHCLELVQVRKMSTEIVDKDAKHKLKPNNMIMLH